MSWHTKAAGTAPFPAGNTNHGERQSHPEETGTIYNTCFDKYSGIGGSASFTEPPHWKSWNVRQ